MSIWLLALNPPDAFETKFDGKGRQDCAWDKPRDGWRKVATCFKRSSGRCFSRDSLFCLIEHDGLFKDALRVCELYVRRDS
jgi:hypothetical protein